MEVLLQANGIEALPLFLTSVSIGLLIGLERERNPSAKAGLRTFALVAVFGTLAAMLSAKLGSPWLLIAGLLAIAAMIISAYVNGPFFSSGATPEGKSDESLQRRTSDNDPGTTTVASLLICYALGALVWYGMSTLAIMLAIGTTLLLYFKPELQGISQRMTRRDLVSILQFCVLSFVILPILPDKSFGPYDAFNPHNAWMMVVLISGLSLGGYIALHWTKQRYGAPLLGFFGGMVSSTATTMVYARHSKTSEDMCRLSSVVILIASEVVLVRLCVIASVVSPAIVSKLMLPLLIGLACGLVVTMLDWNRLRTSSELPMPQTTNPTEIHAALGFGLLYAVVLLCSAWLNDIAGSRGLYVVATISGLTDVDAITLSSLNLFSLDKLSVEQTVSAISIAFISNMAFKFGMLFFIGGKQLAQHVAKGFGAMAVGVAIGILLL